MLQASGVGSGIDVASLVNQLVAAERDPAEQRLKSREKEINSMISAFGTLKSAMSTLQSAMAALKDASSFQNRAATSGDATIFGATAATTAAAGFYNITVANLASAHTLVSPGGADPDYSFTAPTDAVGEGTLDIELGTWSGGTFTQTSTATITIDASNNSLEGMRDAINASGLGVSASIIQDGGEYRLSIASSDTGSTNTIRMTATSETGAPPNNVNDTQGLSRFNFDPAGGASSHLTQAQAGADASFSVNGISLTSASNTVTGAIPDVTLNLKSTGTTTLDVGVDKNSSKESIEAFVSAYNNLVKTINTQTKYTGVNETAGPLISDSMTFGINSSIHKIVGGASTNPGVLKTLTELGYATSTEDGTLYLKDSAKLDDALTNNFDDVGLLVSDLSTKLDSYVGNYLGVSGLIQNRTDGLDSSLKEIERQRERLDVRIESLRTRYSRQFNAMDALVGQMNSTMSFLSQQLATLPATQ
ncbi:MAG: flagellar filament capping protein FliD [Gammaproteobacteria bacterium]|nr:flagellar filament capping protein FliD [Gammaproteobacteria bacterium]